MTDYEISKIVFDLMLQWSIIAIVIYIPIYIFLQKKALLKMKASLSEGEYIVKELKQKPLIVLAPVFATGSGFFGGGTRLLSIPWNTC